MADMDGRDLDETEMMLDSSEDRMTGIRKLDRNKKLLHIPEG